MRPKSERMTQGDIADQIGVSGQFVCLLESGSKQPSLRLAAKIEGLGICPAADWQREARCDRCARAIDAETACAFKNCPYPELAGAGLEAAA